MASNNEPHGKVEYGLDRAPIATYEVVDNDELPKPQADEDVFHGANKIRRLSKKLKSKLSGKSRQMSGSDNDKHQSDAKVVAPTLAPGPRPPEKEHDRFSGEPPEKPDILPFKELVTKPVETIKSAMHLQGGGDFAEKVASTEVSHGASVNLVLAHENITASANDEEESKAMQNFELLKKERQDSLVRWTMDRHIRTVTNVRGQRIPWIDKQEFVRDVDGRKKMHWLDYGHHVGCTFS